MQGNEYAGSPYLGMNPLEALKLQPVALRGGGQQFDNSDPLMKMAQQVAMSAATGTFTGYSGTTSVPKPMGYMGGTTGVPHNYIAGTEEIPGQRTGQDTVPAMLSPGEAVIPASAAQDPANQGAIEGMVEEGRADQGMATQILQSLGLPADPQLIAMIEDMLAQGVPPEQIVQQLQERMGQAQGGQEGGPEAPMAAPMGEPPMEAPMAGPMEGPMEAPMGETMAPQGAPMAAPMEPPIQDNMGMPQGLYGGSSHVQAPLSGKKQREQQKFDSDEQRKNAAFQADQQRKNEMHKRSMSGE